ncbi:aquaporin family protein [Rhodohalobacter sp. SW132]|uniref:MIP/aquaporin family protein n=1 Tax=Rhodohalobacter sp. SW132 TaxID=2293433 RepID=UPI000E26C615|nr:MIP/aquaporin family protein [Rhodohalobacter sp. SW132]REL33039.1 aquaporin family protein [Rhodohalobacter sp. SW132]
MSPYIAEIVGTAILMLLGNGVVANVLLSDSKGQGGGWIVITWGWGIAVFTAVYVVGQFSGAHINPAVTIGLAGAGLFEWGEVPFYIAAQMIGAAIGALLVWLAYKDHFAKEENADLILAVHCTAPAIRKYPSNVMTEAIGTIMLVFGVLYLVSPGFLDADGKMLETIVLNGEEIGFGLGSLSALPVGLLVLGIGLSLGGPTGYAINPARDLGPRIMHAILPIPGKRDNDWAYSWVPVVGPIIGALIAAGLFLMLS